MYTHGTAFYFREFKFLLLSLSYSYCSIDLVYVSYTAQLG